MTILAPLFEGRRAIVVGGKSGVGAGTALRLAEPAARCITGVTLPVDGGYLTA